MTLQLIFNADDYGLTAGVSRGIRQAHLQGVVTSTTCMMGMPGTAAEMQTALAECPNLGLGVHLTLTAGRPVLPSADVAGLCDTNGLFLRLGDVLGHRHELPLEQVEAEWRAQVNAFIQAAGKLPTHLDSHHHSSYFTPALFRVMLKLAGEYGTAIRFPVAACEPYRTTGLPDEVNAELEAALPEMLAEFAPRRADGFCADFYDTDATWQTLADFIDHHPAGTWEVMCHPAFWDDELQAISSYNTQRQQELSLLTSPETLQGLRRRHVSIVNFS